MFLLDKIRKIGASKRESTQPDRLIWYPSSREAEPDPDSQRFVRIPPLMVRKSSWKK